MKNKIENQMIAFLIGCIGLFSCSQADDYNDYPENKLPGSLPISVRAETMDLPVGMQTTVYVFGKSSGDTDYIVKNIILLGDETVKSHPYIESDWSDEFYRFLFVATSETEENLEVVNAANASLAMNDAWLDLRIKADVADVSGDLYYDIVDMTNAQIKADNSSIDGDLTRMVGQMVLEIYRTDQTSKLPMDIVSSKIASVLDRVYQIEIDYTGLTSEIRFDDAGTPVEVAYNGIAKSVTDIIQGDTLQVSVSDNDKLELAVAGVAGSVRIKDLFCLPSSDKIKMKATFHYYDTTPTCEDMDHAHTKECYTKKALELNLPQNNQELEYLSVQPNYYTLNKAGIWLDRIIDLEIISDFSFDTAWVSVNDGNN